MTLSMGANVVLTEGKQTNSVPNLYTSVPACSHKNIDTVHLVLVRLKLQINCFFFTDLKRKTQLQLTYRYIHLCLSRQEKTRSHRVPAMRDTYNNIAFSMKKTVHKKRSVKPWTIQPSTLPFVRRFSKIH